MKQVIFSMLLNLFNLFLSSSFLLRKGRIQHSCIYKREAIISGPKEAGELAEAEMLKLIIQAVDEGKCTAAMSIF